ncbi:hypothetical protein ACHAWF_001529 [Thalassiosira exigua]
MLPSSLQNLPALSDDEVVVDRELGSGGFCTVGAVRRLRLIPPDAPRVNAELARTFLTPSQVDARRSLEGKFAGYEAAYFPSRCGAPGGGQPQPHWRPVDEANRPPRIALKRLRSNLSKEKHRAGLKDLTTEVTLLGLVGNAHPHIIGLHGVGLDAGDVDSPGGRCVISFAIVDQLRCTLNNKLYKWREARGLGIFITNQTLRDLWLERMVVLMQVASAVAFLHEKGIVHRDVTCENVGFDADNCVKLFDFGLARSVGDNRKKSGDENSGSDDADINNDGKSRLDKDENATFDMSGGTGTPRFMAPEVYLDLPYGAKVDVFSLSVVMYQVLSLLQPYANVPPSTFEARVIKGGLRPPLDASWPSELRVMLANMWSSNSADRPASKDVVVTMERILRGSDDGLYPSTLLQSLFSGKEFY